MMTQGTSSIGRGGHIKMAIARAEKTPGSDTDATLFRLNRFCSRVISLSITAPPSPLNRHRRRGSARKWGKDDCESDRILGLAFETIDDIPKLPNLKARTLVH